jgi:hypothetical protein
MLQEVLSSSDLREMAQKTDDFIFISAASPGKNNGHLMASEIKLTPVSYPLRIQLNSASAPCSTQRGHSGWVTGATWEQKLILNDFI